MRLVPDMRSIDTVVNRELLLDFFLTFSRFEYALKNSGCFVKHPERPERPPPAEADWDTFAVSVRNMFDSNKSEELREACRYLLESPPNKQVILNGAPAWETATHDPAVSELELLVRAIRVVRNNLFHGGKYNIEFHQTTERTEKLLRSTLVVLRECLVLAPSVRQAFEEATL
jgi:hypothetical protein